MKRDNETSIILQQSFKLNTRIDFRKVAFILVLVTFQVV